MTPAETAALLTRAGRGSVVYLVGVGGCGMSGLAHLLLDRGHAVAGSDLAANVETRQLAARGARIYQGHRAEQLRGAHPTLVACSSAIPETNPELAAAREAGIPVVRRATLLAGLAAGSHLVCVAGMHGKTTTTAWLAHALIQLGQPAGYAVGALVPQLHPHARLPLPSSTAAAAALPAGARAESPAAGWLVVEADESDGTLREYTPRDALLLNVDAEHLDHYADFATICRAFADLAQRVTGTVLYCADDPHLHRLLAGHPGALSYGFHADATYRIVWPLASPRGGPRPLAEARVTRFELWREGAWLGQFALQLAGEKNVSNAAAVAAWLHHHGFAPSAVGRALWPFLGAARRQEELYAGGGLRVLDDYGHHPREIEPTLRTIKGQTTGRLLVAFQPHRYTRTRDLQSAFAECFRAADQLWLTEIYAASETPIPGVTGAALAEFLRRQGQPVTFVEAPEALPPLLQAALGPGDAAVFMGAGDLTQAAHALAGRLRAERTQLTDAQYAALRAVVGPDTLLRRDEPMARHTTWRVGGPADFFAAPASEAALSALLAACHQVGCPWLILGRGSNLLVRDRGYRGLVLSLSHAAFSRVTVEGDRLRCGAGARLKQVATEARQRGLGGLEFLEGIPGSVGGALRMNAGAMGRSCFDVVERVRFMDRAGEARERAAADIPAQYRSCPFFRDHIALEAVLRGQPTPREAIERTTQEYNQKRWRSQPAAPSAGCVFKNPEAMPAGKLIDELGLKGLRVGDAVVSEVHGNFIVNDGRATAREILTLIDVVRERVYGERGISLETEVFVLGE